MKVALVGATGLVGREMIKVLEEMDFPVSELIPVASARSVGSKVEYDGKKWVVKSLEDAVAAKADIALFSAGGSVSKAWAPRFAGAGTIVVDNSSAWRMDPEVPLVVPEINMGSIGDAMIIANPNCSTIQMVLALAPLHAEFKIKRLVISTYQSVSGTGKNAVQQLMGERAGESPERVYPHPIDLNCLPHCDVFFENGYTREELKMVNETRKILGDESLAITATAVRVPVHGGHSEAINIEFHKEYSLEKVRELLNQMPGIVLMDDPANNVYPTPRHAHGKDDVFVGRLRRDHSLPNTLNMWVVADNLRKGAATNAVQIARELLKTRLASKV